MQSVFLTYSDQDKFIADAIFRHLESNGITCKSSRSSIQTGASQTDAITEVLRGCTAMVLIYSASSGQSEDVIRDVSCAVRSGCAIIPFRLNNASVDKKLEAMLGSVHWLDASEGSLQTNTEALCSYIKVLQPADTAVTQKPSPVKTDSTLKKLLLPAVIIILLLAVVLKSCGSSDNSDQNELVPAETVAATTSVETETTAATTPAETETILETTAAQIFEVDCLGGTYYGTIADDLPHGEGTLCWTEGYYEGSFEHGYPSGTGTFYFSDGSTAEGDDWSYGTTELDMLLGYYSGMLLDGQAAGYGTLTFKYGALYEGCFLRDYPYGEGHYMYYNCSTVSGFWIWAADIPDSWVPERQGAEMSYTGMICDGIPSGLGFLSFHSGGSFMGEFFCGDPWGWGVYSYRSPSSEDKRLKQGDDWITVHGENRLDHEYYGLKLDGKWQGFGVGIKDSGYAYCGEILNDYRDGHGELYTAKDKLERWGIYRKGTIKESYPKP